MVVFDDFNSDEQTTSSSVESREYDIRDLPDGD